MINSKEKGRVGESQWVHFLREHGIEARRGRQYSGSPNSPDVVTSLEGIHFEVKRTELINPYKALKQAIDDAGEKIPVVAHRRSREEWIMFMRADDWIWLLKVAGIALAILEEENGILEDNKRLREFVEETLKLVKGRIPDNS